MNIRPALLLTTVLGLAACSTTGTTGSTAPTAAQVAAESARAAAFFEASYMNGVMRSPQTQSFLGIKTDSDKWDDLSDEYALQGLELLKADLATLRTTLDFELLDSQTRLSYRLFEESATRRIEAFRYRFHNYPVNQMFGVQSGAPSLLINIHRVDSVADAEAYIARLKGMDEYFAQVVENLYLRERLGIVAPKFVYPYVLQDCRNVLRGAPFDNGSEDSTLLADFRGKVGALNIDAATRNQLIGRASAVLREDVHAAYSALMAALEDIETRAGTDDGAWKFPDGGAFYRAALKRTTTTNMTATEIHEIGLREVARIHDEMRLIMNRVEFNGTLQEFFSFMRDDPRFYYQDDEAGRQAYISKATILIDTMRDSLDVMFATRPRADIVVKAVEPFREASAGKAFYQRPAPDGSRPGTYYANLYRMSDMPTYQMEALAYHEGIPGHHMQIAIAQELEGLPKFRRFGRYTVYSEGWGLYSEYLPSEYGFYSDPYSDFGRLAMELWRACRLVVDTGIHDRRWTREQAIDYLASNTPNPRGDLVKAIERYIVMPSQATAYKIGMLRILELRSQAQAELNDRFDIREFHEAILRNGPVPLNVLEELVADYINRRRAG